MKGLIFRLILAIPLAFSTSIVLGVLWTGCLPPKTLKEIADILLTANEVACIIDHDFLESESLIAKECQIVSEKAPAIREVLAAQKRSVARRAAAAQKP